MRKIIVVLTLMFGLMSIQGCGIVGGDKSARKDAEKALEIYNEPQLNTQYYNSPLEDGTIFEVESGGRLWYFEYRDGEIIENNEILHDEPDHDRSVLAGHLQDFPDNVVIYYPID